MAKLEPVSLPKDEVSVEWVRKVAGLLKATTWEGHLSLSKYVSVDTATQILNLLSDSLETRPPLIQVSPPPDGSVVVVGDTHGQLHDVLNMLERVGEPDDSRLFVFNGDFVDRGSWGLEVLLLLAAWQLAKPKAVTLLRGNHESSTCTAAYGFQAEIRAKYVEGSAVMTVYRAAERVFKALPLAAQIAGNTLVVHGGLFRAPPAKATAAARKRRKTAPRVLTAGSLEDLRTAFKGGPDPSGRGKTAIAADVTWSDPVPEPGLRQNDYRGVGLIFGPNITEAFLRDNNLKLIIRSHEGPDARFMVKDDAHNIKQGYSIDHITPHGNLVTVFSAPDYPQHQPLGKDRYNNLAAVAILKGPTFAEPAFLQYSAAARPADAVPFYDVAIPGSDEEMDIAGGASDCSTEGDRTAEARELEVEGEEAVTQPELYTSAEADAAAAHMTAEQGLSPLTGSAMPPEASPGTQHMQPEPSAADDQHHALTRPPEPTLTGVAVTLPEQQPQQSGKADGLPHATVSITLGTAQNKLEEQPLQVSPCKSAPEPAAHVSQSNSHSTTPNARHNDAQRQEESLQPKAPWQDSGSMGQAAAAQGELREAGSSGSSAQPRGEAQPQTQGCDHGNLLSGETSRRVTRSGGMGAGSRPLVKRSNRAAENLGQAASEAVQPPVSADLQPSTQQADTCEPAAGSSQHAAQAPVSEDNAYKAMVDKLAARDARLASLERDVKLLQQQHASLQTQVRTSRAFADADGEEGCSAMVSSICDGKEGLAAVSSS